MDTLFAAILQFFPEEAWPGFRDDEHSVLQVKFQGQNGRWDCFAQAREEQRQFVFYSVCPVNAPVEKRPAVAELLTRANYGLVMGNLEMDFSDGEIRYKTSVDVDGDRLSMALIRQVVYASHAAFLIALPRARLMASILLLSSPPSARMTKENRPL